MRGLFLLAILLAGGVARAEKPTLVAIAPARDARQAIAIGPAGQIYEPDGKGAWIRTKAGGVSPPALGTVFPGQALVWATSSPDRWDRRRYL